MNEDESPSPEWNVTHIVTQTVRADSAEEAERLYSLLSEGGKIFMPMEETFFALRYAQLRDRFGTSWMLLCEHPSTEA